MGKQENGNTGKQENGKTGKGENGKTGKQEQLTPGQLVGCLGVLLDIIKES